MPVKSDTTFNQKEIMVAINNAIAYAKAPNKRGMISEKRLATFAEYAKALFKPLDEELVGFDELPMQDDAGTRVNIDQALTAEDAVLICLCGALYFQLLRVMKSTKPPPHWNSAGVLLEEKS